MIISAGLFVLDRLYYYRLLMSAVEQGAEFERSNAEHFESIGVKNPGLTQRLSDKVNKNDSDAIVLFFWALPLVICVIIAIAGLR